MTGCTARTLVRRVALGLLLAAAGIPAGAQTGQAPPAQPQHDHHHHDHDEHGAAAGQPAGDEAYVERMLRGLYPNLRTATGVIRWKPDFTWDVVKVGTNHLVCFDRSGEDRRNPFAVQCTSLGNLPRVAQNRRFRTESPTNEAEQARVAAAERDGTRIKPEYGSLWININGPDDRTLRVHTTVAVPGATGSSLGLPEDGKKTGAWVMDAGTTSAHIMLPGQ